MINQKTEKVFKQILGKECVQCIKLFGFKEIRCAFCNDNEYYKEYIIDNLKSY